MDKKKKNISLSWWTAWEESSFILVGVFLKIKLRCSKAEIRNTEVNKRAHLMKRLLSTTREWMKPHCSYQERDVLGGILKFFGL